MAKSHRANEEDSSRSFMAGHEREQGCVKGHNEGGYTTACMYKNYNRTGFLVYENIRYMLILNRMQISSDETAFVFNFQLPNGVWVSAYVNTYGNPSQTRSSSAGKCCAHNLINNKNMQI